MICRFCGSRDVEYSESRGESYCTQCGAVLEENRMVGSLTFTESANGSIRASGRFIPNSGFGSGFAASYSSAESREQALQRGYSAIERISSRLRLPREIIEAAQRVFLIGVQRSFTAGRNFQHVSAACLYVSCRRAKAPQLLIDFSDVLTTPVKTLGQVFVKLLRVLRIHVPTIDPSLFMQRFAAKMPLEGQTRTVAETGIRLVQAMTRDWISTGRRPVGLCGAAMLVAARYHGHKINAEDITDVIRMSASTLNKRLHEFKKTSSAQLRVADFEGTDLLALPVLTMPPCLEGRLRLQEASLRNALQVAEETNGDAEAVDLCAARGEDPTMLMLPMASETDAADSTTAKKIPAPEDTPDESTVAGDSYPSSTYSSPPSMMFSASPGGHLTDSRTPISLVEPVSPVGEASAGNPPIDRDRSLRGAITLPAGASELCAENPSSSTIASLANRIVHAIRESPELSSAASDSEPTSRAAIVETSSGMSNDADTTIEPDADDPLRDLLLDVREKCSELVQPTETREVSVAGVIATGNLQPTSYERDQSRAELVSAKKALMSFVPEYSSLMEQIPEQPDDHEEALDDVSDTEVDWMLLSSEEREAKALIWDELMKDIMPEVDRRNKEHRRRAIATKAGSGSAKKPRRTGSRFAEAVAALVN